MGSPDYPEPGEQKQKQVFPKIRNCNANIPSHLKIFVDESLCDLSLFLLPRWSLISDSSLFCEQLYKRFFVFCARLFYSTDNFVFTRSSQHFTFWMTNRVQASSMQVAQNIGTILCHTTFKSLLKPCSTTGKVFQSTAPNQSLDCFGRNTSDVEYHNNEKFDVKDHTTNICCRIPRQ